MTDAQYDRIAERFHRDLRNGGLRVAIELLLDNTRGMRFARPMRRVTDLDLGARAIIEGVAAAYGIQLKAIMDTTCRFHPVPLARHEAMTRIKACGYTNGGVAAFWGCDLSTVSDARKSFRKRMPKRADEIESVAERVGLRLVADEGERRAAA